MKKTAGNQTNTDSSAHGANCGTQGCICGGRGPMASQMLRMMMPEAAGDHFRNASVEFLKGFRELIDHRIQSMSQTQTKGTKVNVD